MLAGIESKSKVTNGLVYLFMTAIECLKSNTTSKSLFDFPVTFKLFSIVRNA